jgi:hypothetical protein
MVGGRTNTVEYAAGARSTGDCGRDDFPDDSVDGLVRIGGPGATSPMFTTLGELGGGGGGDWDCSDCLERCMVLVHD